MITGLTSRSFPVAIVTRDAAIITITGNFVAITIICHTCTIAGITNMLSCPITRIAFCFNKAILAVTISLAVIGCIFIIYIIPLCSSLPLVFVLIAPTLAALTLLLTIDRAEVMEVTVQIPCDRVADHIAEIFLRKLNRLGHDYL